LNSYKFEVLSSFKFEGTLRKSSRRGGVRKREGNGFYVDRPSSLSCTVLWRANIWWSCYKSLKHLETWS